MMDSNKFKKLLKRYQHDTANETEKALIEAWYSSYQESELTITNNIKSEIRSNLQTATQPAKVRHIKWLYFKIAATALLICSAGLLFYKFKSSAKPVLTTVQTKAGEIKAITLADGSLIWVNASSRLHFPEKFKGHFRDVYIDEGEAFFKVKHDTTMPFIVHARKINVQVLGTTFNVNAYHNLNDTKVMVATGKVSVSKNGRRLSVLTPGQQFIISNATGTYSQQNVDIELTQSWKKGFTYLKQATFNELAAVVKSQLGISIKPGSSKINQYRFTLRIQQNLPLGETLQMISQMHNTHFRKEGDDIIIY